MAVLAAAVIGILILVVIYRFSNKTSEKTPRLTPPTECHVGDGFVSVVVPAYNEGGGITLTLSTIDELAQEKSLVEVVVVDAGCKDNTMETVASLKTDVVIRTMTSSGGRGPAMNAGARAARGDVLLFLHADTVVPPAFDATLRDAFQDPKVIMTAFQFGVNRALLRGKIPFALAAMEKITNARTRRLHLPYGDQAFGMTSHKFKAIGGFPDFVMMEDFELVRRLRKEELAGGGEIRILNQTALCAPRRWEAKGVVKNSLLNFGFTFLYSVLDVSPDQIFKWYYGRDPPAKHGANGLPSGAAVVVDPAEILK